MSKPNRNHWRAWLEPQVANVVDSYVRVQPWGSGVTLKIADCTDTISIEFGTNAATSRRKLKALREALDRVEVELERIA